VTEHFPALCVVVPLLSAPVCLLLRLRALARAFACLVAWGCLGMSGALLAETWQKGPISYWLGGWEPPYGIEYRVDVLNALVLVVVTMIASVTLPVGARGAADDVHEGRVHLFCSAFLLCMAGLLGMTVTGDLFNVFVFLEISSLASYTLISLGSRRQALTAALTYLLLGTIGGTFVLIGIGLLYQVTGTLNLADLSARIANEYDHRTVHVAFAFLAVGAAIKLAVFPLHQWLPNAYATAPTAVSAFLAGTGTKVIYYLLVRIVCTLFGASFVFGILRFDRLLVPLSVAAMFAGSAAAIYQKSLKRLLAYSSVAQVGYLTLALGLGTESALTAGLIHLFNHAVMKAGLFLTAGCFVLRTGSDELEALAGIGRRMPISTAAFVVGGLGLIGVPATAGFISKWYLVSAVLERDDYLLAALILVSSLLAVVYVWRVVEVAYFRQPANGSDTRIREAPVTLLLPTWTLAGATVYFGLFTGLPAGAAARAAAELLGGR
jgi:multicomponent Na+:H+ antiporter subunit D